MTRQHDTIIQHLTTTKACEMPLDFFLVLFVPRVVRGFAMVKLACKSSALEHLQSCALCCK
jgi:hypothetical protein